MSCCTPSASTTQGCKTGCRELRRIGVREWPQYATELDRTYTKDGLTRLLLIARARS